MERLSRRLQEHLYALEDGHCFKCPECGKNFYALRYDATFCGPTCRSRFHRQQKRAEKLAAKIDANLRELIGLMPRRKLSKTFETLQGFETRIQYALASVEVYE